MIRQTGGKKRTWKTALKRYCEYSFEPICWNKRLLFSFTAIFIHASEFLFAVFLFVCFILFVFCFVFVWRTSILLNFSEITIFPFQLKRGIGIADVKQKEGPEALR